MHQQTREDLIVEKGQSVELSNCLSVYIRITLKTCFSVLLSLLLEREDH